MGTPPPDLDRGHAVSRVREHAGHATRFLLGVTGAPGAGKSTFAGWLADGLRASGVPSTVVPMDGFHLANSVLAELGRLDRKGAPDTFDAAGYVALLRRLRDERGTTVYAPRFVRRIEESIAGDIAVPPSTRVVVTEGNYLLLDDGAWSGVRALLDEVWYVEAPDHVRLARLVARHAAHGRSAAQARAFAYGSDQRNSLVVAATRDRADAVVTLT